MDYWYYIIIALAAVFVLAFALYFLLRKRKTEENPLILRAKEMMVMIKQRIHSLNSRIQKFDTDITSLMLAKEKEDTTLTSLDISLESIPPKIDEYKEEIRVAIADIEDLKEYQSEIDQIIRNKNEFQEKELENLLDLAKEKLRYRFT